MANPTQFMARDTDSVLYIGKLAELTGATRKAIRHYEAVGLLPKPARRGAYRVYTGRDVFLVHVIKHTQSYGFTLAELRELVAEISKQERFPLKAALDLVRRKQAALRHQAAALRTLDRRLNGLRGDIKKYFG